MRSRKSGRGAVECINRVLMSRTTVGASGDILAYPRGPWNRYLAGMILRDNQRVNGVPFAKPTGHD